MRPALFLDRDGVINIDHGYIYKPKDFDVIDGVFDALRRASENGYALVVVTNQSGIARGYFTESQYLSLEEHIRQVFAAQRIHFDGIYYCPHHPEGKIPEFSHRCDCRKPAPGLIFRAARELDIDLGRSVMVGDKESDVEAASVAGIGCIHQVPSNSQSLQHIIA